jgi:uncharacterized protein (DUF1778 family)
MPTAAAKRSNAVVNVRLPAATRDLIDRAAAVSGKSRTDFMLDSATREAIDVLLDQTLVTLDEEAMAQFQAALDNPPPSNPALRKLLAQKAPWER